MRYSYAQRVAKRFTKKPVYRRSFSKAKRGYGRKRYSRKTKVGSSKRRRASKFYRQKGRIMRTLVEQNKYVGQQIEVLVENAGVTSCAQDQMAPTAMCNLASGTDLVQMQVALGEYKVPSNNFIISRMEYKGILQGLTTSEISGEYEWWAPRIKLSATQDPISLWLLGLNLRTGASYTTALLPWGYKMTDSTELKQNWKQLTKTKTFRLPPGRGKVFKFVVKKPVRVSTDMCTDSKGDFADTSNRFIPAISRCLVVRTVGQLGKRTTVSEANFAVHELSLRGMERFYLNNLPVNLVNPMTIVAAAGHSSTVPTTTIDQINNAALIPTNVL